MSTQWLLLTPVSWQFWMHLSWYVKMKKKYYILLNYQVLVPQSQRQLKYTSYLNNVDLKKSLSSHKKQAKIFIYMSSVMASWVRMVFRARRKMFTVQILHKNINLTFLDQLVALLKFRSFFWNNWNSDQLQPSQAQSNPLWFFQLMVSYIWLHQQATEVHAWGMHPAEKNCIVIQGMESAVLYRQDDTIGPRVRTNSVIADDQVV